MKAILKLFASLSKHLPPEGQRTNCIELELEPGTTVQVLIERYRIPPEQCALVLVNGVFLEPAGRAASVLVDGDVLAIWPPVAGG
jgi:molybdopterin converting factor small subunit